MEERCVALKLLLDALEVPAQIRTVGDRKRLQKSVYLMQLTGVDLGYPYGWYLMGPYSPPLTKDYYQLAAALEEGEDDFKAMTLRAPVLARIEQVKPLLRVPDAVQLAQPEWLELVASLHYLQRVRGLDAPHADQALTEAKPDLAPWVGVARRQLEASALLH